MCSLALHLLLIFPLAAVCQLASYGGVSSANVTTSSSSISFALIFSSRTTPSVSTTTSVARSTSHPASTTSYGTTLSSARSCATALAHYSAFIQDSSTWIYYNFTESVPANSYELPTYNSTRTTTLCDGNPRIVGPAVGAGVRTVFVSASMTTFTTSSQTWPSYTSPTPTCSINVQDCKSLFALDVTVSGKYPNNAWDAWPVCNTTAPSPTRVSTTDGQGASALPLAFGQTPTNSTNSPASGCDSECIVVAKEAKLLYWPVRVKTDNLCNIDGQLPVETITATPTGHGPNTYVTEGITITSPSVAISIAGISRKDGCYNRTIASTIIPVDPSDVTSIRGGTVSVVQKRDVGATSVVGGLQAINWQTEAYAATMYQGFRFQDLNYRCLAANGSEYIADGPGADCFPLVPSLAYFSAPATWKWDNGVPQSILAEATIADVYAPYIGLPSALASWVTAHWDVKCILSTCGVWDPPAALPTAAAEAMPTVPSQPTTTQHTAMKTSAMPAQSVPSQVAQTSATRTESGTSTTAVIASAGSPTHQAASYTGSFIASTHSEIATPKSSSLDTGVTSSESSVQTTSADPNASAESSLVAPVSVQNNVEGSESSKDTKPTSSHTVAQTSLATQDASLTSSTTQQVSSTQGLPQSSLVPVSRSSTGEQAVGAVSTHTSLSTQASDPSSDASLASTSGTSTSSCNLACYIASALSLRTQTIAASQGSSAVNQDPGTTSSEAGITQDNHQALASSSAHTSAVSGAAGDPTKITTGVVTTSHNTAAAIASGLGGVGLSSASGGSSLPKDPSQGASLQGALSGSSASSTSLAAVTQDPATSQNSDPGALSVTDGSSSASLNADGSAATPTSTGFVGIWSAGSTVLGSSVEPTTTTIQANQGSQGSGSSQVTIDEQSFVIISTSDKIILTNIRTSLTVSSGGAAVSVGTQMVSAGSSGLVAIEYSAITFVTSTAAVSTTLAVHPAIVTTTAIHAAASPSGDGSSLVASSGSSVSAAAVPSSSLPSSAVTMLVSNTMLFFALVGTASLILDTML